MSFKDAPSGAFGHPVEQKDHLYVLGATEDESAAFSSARASKEVLPPRMETERGQQALDVEVMQIEDRTTFYVVVGGLRSYGAVLNAERLVRDTVLAVAEKDRGKSAVAKL